MRKIFWILLFAFLGGILLANMWGKDFLTGYGILNLFWLKQYTCHGMDCDRLFCYVLLERVKTVFFILIMGKLVGGRNFFLITEGIFAMVTGFLLVAGIMNLGIRGIVVIAAGMLPQWVIYQMAFVLYTKCHIGMPGGSFRRKGIGKEKIAYIGILLVITVIYFLGIMVESYVNPPIFEKILKIF